MSVPVHHWVDQRSAEAAEEELKAWELEQKKKIEDHKMKNPAFADLGMLNISKLGAALKVGMSSRQVGFDTDLSKVEVVLSAAPLALNPAKWSFVLANPYSSFKFGWKQPAKEEIAIKEHAEPKAESDHDEPEEEKGERKRNKKEQWKDNLKIGKEECTLKTVHYVPDMKMKKHFTELEPDDLLFDDSHDSDVEAAGKEGYVIKMSELNTIAPVLKGEEWEIPRIRGIQDRETFD